MPKIYAKNTWLDRVISGALRYDIKDNTGTSLYSQVQLLVHNAISQAGSALTAAWMNNIENGIDGLDTKIQYLPSTLLMADGSINLASKKISSMATGVAATDAATVGQAEPSLSSQGDNRNAFTRLTGYSPTSHLNSAPAGFAYAAYAGFVTPTEDYTMPSLMRLYSTVGTAGNTRFFKYKSYSQVLQTVCYIGIENSRAGLRMDDGTNNNYVELFLESQTDGSMKLRYRSALAGVVTGPTDEWGGMKLPLSALKLQLINFSSSIGLFASGIDVINMPLLNYIATGWTPTRVGFYGEHPNGAALDNQRASIFDSYYAS